MFGIEEASKLWRKICLNIWTFECIFQLNELKLWKNEENWQWMKKRVFIAEDEKLTEI